VTFLSLVAALLIEQWRPLDRDHAVVRLFAAYAERLERQFNAGESRHGVMAWLLAVAPLAAAVALVQSLAGGMAAALEWAWCVAVLYATMGLRKFSHVFTDIQEALARDDVAAARDLLSGLRGQSAGEFTRGETARVAIEEGLLLAHRHVFGVIAWFVVFGPAGAAGYRAAAMLAERWGTRGGDEFGDFGRFAARAFEIMDWVPARLTALSFAVAGDFEDAVYCWRTQAASWAPRAAGILLATGAGALGVRLGEALHQYGGLHYRPELGTGDEADADYMRSAVGLVWRTLVIWMLLILLLSLAHWAG
jgi:adenosylcobinamide-phosphate synthase